jgi:hypothetical protein
MAKGTSYEAASVIASVSEAIQSRAYLAPLAGRGRRASGDAKHRPVRGG